MDLHGELASVVIAPHGGFAAGDFLAGRGEVPAVGTMVDGVEDEAFVVGIGGEIGLGEESFCDGEAGLEVAVAALGIAGALKIEAEAEQTLGADGGGAAVGRFVGVEGLGGAVEVIAHVGETGRAGVPVGNAVGGGVFEVEIGDGGGDMEEAGDDLGLAAERGELGFGEGFEEFDFLRVAAEDPGEAASPGGEGGVTLLAVGAAVGAVVDVENRFVGGASAHVVAVAAFAIEDGVASGGFGVLKQAGKEGDGAVHFAHELVAELMGDGEGAEGANGVGEEGVRSVEGVDVAELGGEGGPAGGLDGAAGLEGEFVEIFFPGIEGDKAGGHETQEVAVGADVVEAVVVDADVGDVGGHEVDGVAAGDVEEGFVAGEFELVGGGAELEALGPFGPAAGGVGALDGEDGGAEGGIPAVLEAVDFGAGEGGELVDGGEEGGGREVGLDVDHGEGNEVSAKGEVGEEGWGGV
jgi:hypothetical protein